MSKKSRKLETDVEPIEFADTPACLGDLDDMEMQQRTPKADLVRAEIQSTQQSGRMRSLTPARTPQRSLGTAIQKSKPRLTPRLRHDDSQIQFAPIVSSSPPNLEMLESQLLTDRQKEVRERQNEAASAMFPNLRSSPRAKSQEKTAIYPRLQLEVSHILADHSDLDDLASPTLPPQREMKEFLGSSPTPSQRRSSSRDKARDSQVRNRQSTPTDVPVSAAYDDPPSSPPIATTGLVNTIGSSEEIQQAGTSDIETMNLDILVDVRSLKPETHRLANDNILSDDDVFVDAPLSQDQGEAPQDDANDVSMEDAAQSNNVIDQISSSDPIDKVSAQISFDMERAASQVSEQAAKGSESDASDNSQRQVGNSTPSQPASHVKRSRGRPRKGSTQADPPKEYTVVEDEYMLDCIIVADPGVGASSPHSSPGDTRQPRKRQIDEVETATIPSTAELPPPKKIARLDRVVGGYVNGHDVPARTPATRRSSRLSREPTEPLEGMHEQTGEDVVREEVVERVPSPCFVTAGGDEEPETNGPSSPVHFEREEVQIEPITDGTSISKGEEDEGIMNLELSWESISGPLRAMLDTARKMNAENTTLTGNSREAMSMFFDLGKELNELASWTRG